jgi:prepilin-type N-terminal cleavage/methylation domain-containing protein
MGKSRGFSLIELLIVIAVILIIAALAVPNLLRSRMAANESSAVQTLRTISTANVTYSSIYGTGYAEDLNYMAPPAGAGPTSDAADLLDSTVSGCPGACTSNLATKSGYNFSYTPDPAGPPFDTFTVVAVPIGPSTGQNTFCLDQTGVILRDLGGATTTANGNGCVADGWVGGTISPI